MSFKVKIFILGYIALHIIVALAGVRYWPLTDYPMFGEAFGKVETVRVLRYKVVFDDGRQEWAKRAIGRQFGVYKGRKFLTDDKKIQEWQEIILSSLKEVYRDFSNIRSFQVVERLAQRRADTLQYAIQDQVIYEFPIQ